MIVASSAFLSHSPARFTTHCASTSASVARTPVAEDKAPLRKLQQALPAAARHEVTGAPSRVAAIVAQASQAQWTPREVEQGDALEVVRGTNGYNPRAVDTLGLDRTTPYRELAEYPQEPESAEGDTMNQSGYNRNQSGYNRNSARGTTNGNGRPSGSGSSGNRPSDRRASGDAS